MFKAVILNQGQFCPPLQKTFGNIWWYFRLSQRGEGYWHVMGGGQRCWQILYIARTIPPQKKECSSKDINSNSIEVEKPWSKAISKANRLNTSIMTHCLYSRTWESKSFIWKDHWFMWRKYVLCALVYRNHSWFPQEPSPCELYVALETTEASSA